MVYMWSLHVTGGIFILILSTYFNLNFSLFISYMSVTEIAWIHKLLKFCTFFRNRFSPMFNTFIVPLDHNIKFYTKIISEVKSAWRYLWNASHLVTKIRNCWCVFNFYVQLFLYSCFGFWLWFMFNSIKLAIAEECWNWEGTAVFLCLSKDIC